MYKNCTNLWSEPFSLFDLIRTPLECVGLEGPHGTIINNAYLSMFTENSQQRFQTRESKWHAYSLMVCVNAGTGSLWVEHKKITLYSSMHMRTNCQWRLKIHSSKVLSDICSRIKWIADKICDMYLWKNGNTYTFLLTSHTLFDMYCCLSTKGVVLA